MGRLSAHVSTRKHTRGKKKREWMLEKEKRRESEYLLSGIYHQQACYRNTERCCLAIISREIEAVLRITAPVAPEALSFLVCPNLLALQSTNTEAASPLGFPLPITRCEPTSVHNFVFVRSIYLVY